MIDFKQTVAVDRLRAFTRGIRIDEKTLDRIITAVEAEARTSLTWGTVDQRIAEIRQRLITL